MGQSMKGILLMGQGLEKENGFHLLKKHNLTNMKVNMIKTKKMGSEFINGRMDLNMKAFSKMISKRVKGRFGIKMGR